jgi:periplasmic protein TonB
VFSRLVASAGGGSQFRRPAVIAGSIAAHIALLAGVIWASAPDTADAETEISDLEEVTYIEIAEAPPPPDMVFEEPPADVTPPPAEPPPAAVQPARPAPAPRRTAPAQPRTPPAPSALAEPEPAGFQELRTPPAVQGIAPPDQTAAPVRAEDFGGRGQAGGTAGGARADSSAAGTRIGRGGAGTADGTGTGGDGPPTGTFSANLVDRRASLSNQSEVVRVMQRLYPNDLKESWTEGSVRVQFVVTAEGRVDMSTVQVLSTTHPQFRDATLQALKDFRFTPARKGDHNVRMLTMLPIEWKLQRH